MTGKDLRQKFLKFFESKGHKIISSSSLIPENDPTVLLTTAGMQQLKPYFAGQRDVLNDFGSENLASIQKCFRTTDIDEVGDSSHLTFFEMLGNFSIGGYGKQEAIEYAWQLLTSKDGYNLSTEDFYVTVFAGDEQIPEDVESAKIWRNIAPGVEIKKLGRDDNFWPKPIWVGTSGPSSEIHYKLPNGSPREAGSLEIWNLVFTQFYHHGGGRFEDLGSLNIDTGMGLERLSMIVQGCTSIFETNLFLPIIRVVEKFAGKEYGKDDSTDRKIRIIADHIRAITFLIADGVEPGSKDRGYILRRIIRRALTHAKLLREDFNSLDELMEVVMSEYGESYPNIKEADLKILQEEQTRFRVTLKEGLQKYQSFGEKISGEEVFLLFQSFGFPIELTLDLAKEDGKLVNKEDFDQELRKHQTISRS